MAPVLVTLNEGHSPVVGLLKCNPTNICAVFYQISTDSALARSLSDSWASCFLVGCAEKCASSAEYAAKGIVYRCNPEQRHDSVTAGTDCSVNAPDWPVTDVLWAVFRPYRLRRFGLMPWRCRPNEIVTGAHSSVSDTARYTAGVLSVAYN